MGNRNKQMPCISHFLRVYRGRNNIDKMNENLSNIISNLLVKHGMNQTELAHKIKVVNPKSTLDRSRINRFLTKDLNLKRSVCVEIITQGFGYTKTAAEKMISGQIIAGESEKLNSHEISRILNLENVDLGVNNLIPMFDSVGAGFVADGDVEVRHYYPLTPDIKYAKDRLFYASVQGRSMEPTIHQGDMVLVLRDGHDLEDGKLYVWWIDGDYGIRRFRRITNTVYQLVCDNPAMDAITVEPKDQEKIYAVGKILRISKKVE